MFVHNFWGGGEEEDEDEEWQFGSEEDEAAHSYSSACARGASRAAYTTSKAWTNPRFGQRGQTSREKMKKGKKSDDDTTPSASSFLSFPV